MSLPTLPLACRASSVITFVPASLYRRQETHGFSGDYFCHSMVMASKRIFMLGKTHRIRAGRISWIGPILTFRDCQSLGGAKGQTNRGVSMPPDAFVMAEESIVDAR